MIQEIKTYLAQDMEHVERVIDDALKSDVALLDATNRSLRNNSGKMMRPLLALLCAHATGSVNEDTYRFAAASELLHNATLLHDDVVDGAAQRRGLPTVASLLGSSAAVLIGDYWLSKVVETILSASAYSERVIRLFAHTISCLAEGELLQMQKAVSGDTTQEDYIRIIYSKTASLFESAAASAAISVKAPEKVIAAMGEFAKNLGIAFQIKDDWLDYAASSSALGKPIGQDLLEQKITQPLLCAFSEVSHEEEIQVRHKVIQVSSNPELVKEIVAFVKEHNGVELCARKADEYIDKAIACLDFLEDGPQKDRLADLAKFVGLRGK